MRSSDRVWREIRRWLDVVDSQLENVARHLTNAPDSTLTPEGVAGYVFLAQTRHSLSRGSMVLESEIRRALDLFMQDRETAFRRRVGLSVSPAPSCYQEVARNHINGDSHTSSSASAGGSRPIPGPQLGVSATDLIQSADRNPSDDLFIASQWYTLENGDIVWNGLLVDRNGIPEHRMPFIYRGHMRRLCTPHAG